MRAFLSFILSILFVLGFGATAAEAQSTQPTIGTPWVTYNSTGPTFFATPTEACRSQYEDLAGGSTSVFEGAEPGTYPVAYNCGWTNHYEETGPIVPLPAVVLHACPDGATLTKTDPPYCVNNAAQTSTRCDATEIGNPITLFNGAKVQRETDYVSADGRFSIERVYNSRPWGVALAGGRNPHLFAQNWNFASVPNLWFDVLNPRRFTITMADGQALSATRLNDDDISWDTGFFQDTVNGDIGRWSFKFLGTPPAIIGDMRKTSHEFELTNRDGIKYIFKTRLVPGRFFDNGGYIEDAFVHGQPAAVHYPGGYKQFMTYGARGEILTLSDNLGRNANFDWMEYILGSEDEFGVITPFENNLGPAAARLVAVDKITISDGTVLNYSYDNAAPESAMINANIFTRKNLYDRLIRAERISPAGVKVWEHSYEYKDSRFPYALTGLVDSAGITYGNWTYDDQGRAITSSHPDGVELETISYTDGATEFTRTVTNSLDRDTIYTYGNYQDRKSWLKKIDGQPSSNCVGDTRSIEYNENFNGTNIFGPAERKTDKEGRVTEYTRDGLNRILTKTVAVGTTEEFTQTYTWDDNYINNPLSVDEPDLLSEYSYDGEGRLLSMTQTDKIGLSAPRTWTFGHTGPHMTSMDGPLPGADDSVTMEYVQDRLVRVTNELGHVTDITDHHSNGAPARIIDANSVETVLAYDGLDRLTSILRSGAQTQIEYSPTSLVTSITLPNATSLTFVYDDARRLMSIENAEGETITYTRNAMGGILQTDVTGSTGGLSYTISSVTDEINRVIEATGVNALTKFSYDREDNLTEIIDPREETWQQSFDNLDRLKTEINPLGGTTDYQMDAKSGATNPLTGVTDPRGITTNYVRNGYGEVIREVSAEAGTAEYTRDEAGRITQMTEARGVISNFVYDAADRLLSISYPDSPADDIAYGYDDGQFGIGELTSITERFGVTTYGYDSLGHMTAMSRTINGIAYDCAYEYDQAGEITAMVYPSGRRISFTRDLAARITSVSMTDADGTVTTLADNITYQPFGPLSGMALGDGHNLAIDYDLNYRATRLLRSGTSGSLMDRDFEYDPAGDITAMNDNIRPDRSQSFGYDALSRLTSADGGYGSINYGYNAGGDRTNRDWSKADGSLLSETYGYETTTARLMSVSVLGADAQMTPIRNFGYAPSGQVTTDSRTAPDGSANIYSYGINARGRMSTVTLGDAQIASYTYDESEQRIIKTAANQTTHYHYDSEGRLIAETDGDTGETIREYIWLGLMPIAVIAPTEDTTTGTGECDQTLVDALTAELAASIAASDALAAQIADWDGNVAFREDKIAEMQAQLATLSGKKAEKLAEKIERWEGMITDTSAKIGDAEAELTLLDTQITDTQTALTAQQALCDGSGPVTNISGTYYLHADHLGRPQFATDSDGSVVWDMGDGVTPFGEGVNLAGAFAQKLMFPGQYADAETGAEITLSHNWHRTYDPTLGRYLQADPIGLAGGLNRYAYVGGNPISWIDSTGEIANFAIGAIAGAFGGLAIAILTGDECYSLDNFLVDAAMGAAGVGIISKANKLNRIRKLRKLAKKNGLTKPDKFTAGGVEDWKGTAGKRLKIKHRSGVHKDLNPASKRPRFEWKDGPGQYRDPFTGFTGTQKTAGHVPLEPDHPILSGIGGFLFGANSADKAVCNCQKPWY